MNTHEFETAANFPQECLPSDLPSDPPSVPVLCVEPIHRHEAHQACLKWHYSRTLPAVVRQAYGVWEDDRFIGAIVYGCGVNKHIARCVGLDHTQSCELIRVALDTHTTPVTQIVAESLRLLKRKYSAMLAVISYSDCDQNHHGGIYQAGNWVYLGKVELNGGTARWRLHGEVVHGRSVSDRYGRGSQNLEWLRANVDPGAEAVYTRGKHKYVYPLEKRFRKQIAPLHKPYPKRSEEA